MDGQCTRLEEICTKVALAKVRAQEIYNMYIGTAEQGELQESKPPPSSSGASVRSGVVLSKLLHAGHIYRQLPAESGRDGTRVWGER